MELRGVSRAFNTVKKVVYGKPYIEAVMEEVRARNSKALLLVSRTLDSASSPLVRDLETALGGANAFFRGKFSGVRPHTPDTDVVALAQRVQDCGADTIITLGGGSLVDAAKGAKVARTYTMQKGSDFRRLQTTGQLFNPLGETFSTDLTVINLPTTLSAGEHSCIAGIKDTHSGQKFGYVHPTLTADVVILDPHVTEYTPDWLFLSTGVRALDHCIETLCSVDGNLLAQTSALKALSLLARGLPDSSWAAESALDGNSDVQARLKCQLGTWLSMLGICQGVPMGASHGIGHVLGAKGVPHGYTSCVMLPRVLKYNYDVIPKSLRDIIVKAMRYDPGLFTPHQAVFDFLHQLGMPQTLKAVGIKREQLKEIAEHSMMDNWVKSNPKPINVEEALKLLESAYDSTEL